MKFTASLYIVAAVLAMLIISSISPIDAFRVPTPLFLRQQQQKSPSLSLSSTYHTRIIPKARGRSSSIGGRQPCPVYPFSSPSSSPSALHALPDSDLLESAGTSILNFMSDLNYGAVFAGSLLPYLGFLWNVWPNDYPGMPKATKWGFASLLIFVISTIIGGIAAKLIYNEVLANVDYIHGTAESLLGVTNIVCAISVYRALEAAKREAPDGKRPKRWQW